MPDVSPPAEVAHLLRRASFGVTAERVRELSTRTWEEVLKLVVDQATPPEVPRDLRFRNNYDESGEDLRADLQTLFAAELNRLSGLGLSATGARHPGRKTFSDLGDRMLWFWHGHFATGAAKVRLAPLLYRQHQLLAFHALGNFRQLLLSLTTDAAMLVYLDGHASLGRNPNENFAQALLELFALGAVGESYQVGDVKAASRALAGWYVAGYPELYGPYDPEAVFAVFDPGSGYAGEVTFLKHTARFDVAALIDRILTQPACAELIAKKLFQYFIHPEPDRRTVEDLAAVFRGYQYDIRPLLSALFRHPDFLSPKSRGGRARLPLELLLAAAAACAVRTDFFDQAAFLHEMGQVPFEPPDMAGWPLDARWLGPAQALARTKLGSCVFKLPDSNPAVRAIAAATDPVAATLRQASLYDLSLTTRAGMVDLAGAIGEPVARARALLALAIASPEFALA